MTDIVEMLRKTAKSEFGTYDVRDDSVRIGCNTLRDAADEIDRLRKENQELENSLESVGYELKERT
jgi:hypothetical protein